MVVPNSKGQKRKDRFNSSSKKNNLLTFIQPSDFRRMK